MKAHSDVHLGTKKCSLLKIRVMKVNMRLFSFVLNSILFSKLECSDSWFQSQFQAIQYFSIFRFFYMIRYDTIYAGAISLFGRNSTPIAKKIVDGD